MKTSLFIFRRDLRLDDNTALLEACESSDVIIPCFIFDPRQAGGTNDHFSANAFQFMIESLVDLDARISAAGGRLRILDGIPEEVVASLLESEEIDAVFFNRDYTPFSRERDDAIRRVCESRGVRVVSSDDALLTVPGEVLTSQGSTYQVYSYFARKAMKSEPPRPRPFKGRFHEGVGRGARDASTLPGRIVRENPDIHVRGGREQALRILSSIDSFDDYDESRNLPAREDGTTSLSAYHKFGCVSARETFWAVADAFGVRHTLIAELYWRDFFTLLAHAHPHVFGGNFRREYDSIRWRRDEARFEAWKRGTTGFPIVDAGMRQLSTTGWMHNRVRMIVASFLVKDLQIDWRWGERHFAHHLVDYDPAVNNGNWQWAASTGADAQPYFRIFNPWNQAKRYDPDARYIRHWIPELAGLEARSIHNLAVKRPPGLDYPEPIVDHRSEAERAQRMFEQAAQG